MKLLIDSKGDFDKGTGVIEVEKTIKIMMPGGVIFYIDQFAFDENVLIVAKSTGSHLFIERASSNQVGIG